MDIRVSFSLRSILLGHLGHTLPVFDPLHHLWLVPLVVLARFANDSTGQESRFLRSSSLGLRESLAWNTSLLSCFYFTIAWWMYHLGDIMNNRTKIALLFLGNLLLLIGFFFLPWYIAPFNTHGHLLEGPSAWNSHDLSLRRSNRP